MVFPELYKIKTFLKNPNLRFRLAFLDMEEYKLLNGWSKDKKKGASRFDRIPTEFVREVTIDRPEDYMQFVPLELEDAFTSKDFAKAVHIPVALSQTVLNILYHMETVERVGKKGNMYLYQPREI